MTVWPLGRPVRFVRKARPCAASVADEPLLAPGVAVGTTAPLTSWYGLLASGEQHQDNCNLQGANVVMPNLGYGGYWDCAYSSFRIGILYNNG